MLITRRWSGALIASFAAVTMSGLWAAQTTPDSAELEAIVTRRVSARRNAAIVAGITSRQGRRIIARGSVTLPDGAPPTGDTLFEIGSLTKVFTATLLADMVRRNELHLGDSAFSYFRPLESRAREPRTVTLADLATHTSGFPLWPSSTQENREGVVAMGRYTDQQLIEYLAGFRVPDDVGRSWRYSNVDFGLLGAALANRAGKTYDALLRERLSGPLGMHSTVVTVSDALRGRLAHGYDAALASAPEWNVPALTGSGSLHSTVNDLLTFLEAFADDRGRLAPLLPIIVGTTRPGPGFSQALGWWLLPDAETGILVHDGGTLGFAGAMAYEPKTRVGIVILSNTANSVGDIARHFLRPEIPLTPESAAAPPATAATTLAPELLARLTGRYRGQSGNVIEIAVVDGGLLIQLPGTPRLHLRAEGSDRFSIVENASVGVAFAGSPDAPATELTLTTPGGKITATRVPEP